MNKKVIDIDNVFDDFLVKYINDERAEKSLEVLYSKLNKIKEK